MLGCVNAAHSFLPETSVNDERGTSREQVGKSGTHEGVEGHIRVDSTTAARPPHEVDQRHCATVPETRTVTGHCGV